MKSLNTLGKRTAADLPWAACTPVPEQLGVELKQMFGGLTAGPMPDRMMQLADALEEAFQRGELFGADPRRIS